jgi:hypothetical protein
MMPIDSKISWVTSWRATPSSTATPIRRGTIRLKNALPMTAM